MSKINELIILHDLDGRPYYKALESLGFSKVYFFESSVVRLFIRDVFKSKKIKFSFKRLWKNILFRFSVPFLRNKVIVVGMAPNDFRIIYYSLLRKKNKFIIHTSHPYWDDPKKSIRKYGSYFDNIFRKIWVKFLNDPNVSIVCVTKSSFNSLCLFSGSKKAIQIYHSVDENIYYPDENKKISDVIHIAFIGNFIFSKGLVIVKYLAESLRMDARFQFHIIGDGDEKFLLSEVLSYPNVNYYGRVDSDKYKSEILRRCDILINPSLKTKKWEELFGIVNIEGMMTGLAIIASKHIGPSEIITSDIGILIDDGEKEEFLNSIRVLQSNPDLLLFYKKNSVKKSKEFTFSYASKKWKDVIDD